MSTQETNTTKRFQNTSYSELYKKEDSETVEHSDIEQKYKTQLLDKLVKCIAFHNQPIKLFSNKTYRQKIVANREVSGLFKAGKQNENDKEYTSGALYEKIITQQQQYMKLNLKPVVRILDIGSDTTADLGIVLTSALKKSILIEDPVKSKELEKLRVLSVEGDLATREFVSDDLQFKKTIKKNKEGKITIEKYPEITFSKVESEIVRNENLYLGDTTERDINKQPYIFWAIYTTRENAFSIWGEMENFKYVPKSIERQISEYGNNNQNDNQTQNDYCIYQQSEGFCEVIVYENKMKNEFQVMINGVMMYPVDIDENEEPVGFPLTEINPSGNYSITRGSNEIIPNFAYSFSLVDKGEAKQKIIDELTRNMMAKKSYENNPTVLNGTTTTLDEDLFDGNQIVKVEADFKVEDIKILKLNDGVTQQDVSLIDFFVKDLDNSSLPRDLEGVSTSSTATQGVNNINFGTDKLNFGLFGWKQYLQNFYWNRLYSIINSIDKKVKKLNPETLETYEDFEEITCYDFIEGKKVKIIIKFSDKDTETNSYDVLQQEQDQNEDTRIFYVNSTKLKDLYNSIKSYIWIDIVSESNEEDQRNITNTINNITGLKNITEEPLRINNDLLKEEIAEVAGIDSNDLFMKAEDTVQQSNTLPTEPQQSPQNNVLAQGVNGL